MLVRSPSFEQFESYLESVLDGAAAKNANGPLIREHFGLDDPTAKRGKRLRPQILLTVAEGEGGDGTVALGAAAALELLHNFSLIHDDIEDGDELRHGRPTLWTRHGVRAALVAGDAMSALAYLTLVDGSHALPAATVAAMLRCLQEAHFRMCEGQAFDIGFETATFVTFDEYLRMIEGKTAALLAVACELGAWAAGAPSERAAAYGSVGRAYGLAFQVRDDVLGTWGRTEETGKPSGADIRRRKWSFPVAWALAQPPSADRSIVADAYATIGMLSEEHAARVIAALDRLGARDAADRACMNYIDEANTISASHGIDGDGRLAALFRSTAKRTT
ncbi:MAG TPA: polyprenyl synthetase family protein [Candidatus Aquilonibacter sp.]